MRLIDADKLIDSLRASLNHGRETFPVDLIVEAIENQLIEENICCSKESHAYQNDDRIYYVVKIKERYMIGKLCETKIREYFVGEIVNETSTNLYFELKNTNELVIIPHKYIEWLAPEKDEKK